MSKMSNQQILSIGDDLIVTAKDLFPQHAEIDSRYDFDRLAFVCTIHWKLNNDDSRPNKTSRIILIVIPREVLEDTHYERRKQIVRERFKRYLEKKTPLFNPDHNELYGNPPPVEEWLVVNNLLNQ